jgi:chorismate--pyruvate lyase
MSRHIPIKLAPWLFDSGSFMSRLKIHGVQNARVRVLREGWSLPTIQERIELNMPARTFAWIREVFIYSDKTIWMFARTVIPVATLTGKELQLRQLKTRSLGSMLFKNPNMQRSEFDFYCVEPETKWHKKIAEYSNLNNESLWARRSLFSLSEKSLLLTEIFFPGIAQL